MTTKVFDKILCIIFGTKFYALFLGRFWGLDLLMANWKGLERRGDGIDLGHYSATMNLNAKTDL